VDSYHVDPAGTTPAYVQPELGAARAALLTQIARRPVPAPPARPAAPPALNHTQRQMLRLADAPDRVIAIALAVAPRTVTRWRRGQHRPTPRHAYQLWALSSVIFHHDWALRGRGVAHPANGTNGAGNGTHAGL
jgi:hypothetical protein